MVYGKSLCFRLLGCVGVLMATVVTPAIASPVVHSGNASLLQRANSPTWSVVNDTVMGGQSVGRVNHSADGPTFSGTLVTQGGGFVSVRTRDLVSLKDTDRWIRLKVRGDGRTWRFCLYLRGDPRGVSRQIPITTQRGEVTEHLIDIRESVARWRGRQVQSPMPSNLSQVAGIGLLLADGNSGQFEITVLDAQVVTGS